MASGKLEDICWHVQSVGVYKKPMANNIYTCKNMVFLHF